MKKGIKKIVSLAVSATILGTGFPLDGFNIGASAASEDISTTLTYAEDGTALLTITPSEWENPVRYTLDGSVPTEDSPLYLKQLEISEKTLVRIAEFENGKKKNGIKTTVTPKTAPVSFYVEQDYDEGSAVVTLDCETVGAKIYYTTDGSKPSEDSKLYTGELNVGGDVKIRARAYCDGYLTTTTYLRNVKVKKNKAPEENEVEVKDPNEEVSEASSEEKTEEVKTTKTTSDEKETSDEKTDVKEIVVEKDSEESSVKQKIDYKFTYMDNTQKTYVTLIKSKASNVIRYTTDGSAVSKNSKKYSSRVAFTEPGVFRAKEYTSSGKLVATLKVNVQLKCAAVEFGCIGVDKGIRTITLHCDTPDTTIYYTTDCSNPTPENGYVYTSPLVVGELVDIKAIAVRDGYKKSTVAWEIAGRVSYELQNFDFSDPAYTEAAAVINDYRIANGYKTLVLDEGLTRAASVRAYEASVYLDHTRPDGSSYASAISDEGVEFNYSSEYYAYNKKSGSEFARAIVADSNNKSMLLETGYDAKKVGIGYCKKGQAIYWILLISD